MSNYIIKWVDGDKEGTVNHVFDKLHVAQLAADTLNKEYAPRKYRVFRKSEK
jgi:hypothetical protein